MPEGVANIVAEEGIEGMVLTTESGTIGGVPASGGDFGVTTNPDTILHQSFQFDFYDGGGLDIAFLGLAQCDSHGNINVSKFGPKIAGCGGFINITQNTPVVVFCGTFTVKGKNKFLKDVEQITFSADFANKTGQKVLYVTECCVFKLTKEGVELIYNKFISVLGQNGVKVIETKDKPLDTDYHEAIAVVPAPSEKQKGKILDCVQTGYTLNDKVLRHAKVVVGE